MDSRLEAGQGAGVRMLRAFRARVSGSCCSVVNAKLLSQDIIVIRIDCCGILVPFQMGYGSASSALYGCVFSETMLHKLKPTLTLSKTENKN